MTDSGVRPDASETPIVLAIDVGTSSTRCIAYDARGRGVDGWESHRLYGVEATPDGGATVDADFILALTEQCIDDVLTLMGGRSRDVGAVACDTFWHSVLGIDASERPTTPVFTWADMRSVDAARYLRGKLDIQEVHARTGAEIHPSYLPAKLLWLHDAMPREFARSRYWMSLGEYLYLRLFGRRIVSISMASGTGLFDQHRCTYDATVLDALPVDVEQLSPIADYSEALHDLQPEFAGRWPALRACPWYLPVGDGAANNIGSGGYAGDDVVVMIGTSGAMRVVRETSDFATPPGLWSYRVDKRRVVQGGALSSGGNVWAWLVAMFNIRDPREFEARLADIKPDSHGLTVLPFLAGERSPRWNPAACSAMVGATLSTTTADVVRAFVESTSFEFGMVFDILKKAVPTVRGIIGSGSGLIHSTTWMQIMTDVLGAPVTTCAAKEATSRGGALLALQALELLGDLSDAPAPFGRTYQPNLANYQTYQRAASRQQSLYELLVQSRADAPDGPRTGATGHERERQA